MTTIIFPSVDFKPFGVVPALGRVPGLRQLRTSGRARVHDDSYRFGRALGDPLDKTASTRAGRRGRVRARARRGLAWRAFVALLREPFEEVVTAGDADLSQGQVPEVRQQEGLHVPLIQLQGALREPVLELEVFESVRNQVRRGAVPG